MLAVFDSALLDLTGWGRYGWGYGPWSADPNNVVIPVGLPAEGSVGAVFVTGIANVTVTGVEGSAAVGVQSVTAAANAFVSGVSCAGALGITAWPAPVHVTGISATGVIGTPLVWSQIDDAQDPAWIAISSGQVPVWQNINDAQVPGWTPIVH